LGFNRCRLAHNEKPLQDKRLLSNHEELENGFRRSSHFDQKEIKSFDSINHIIFSRIDGNRKGIVLIINSVRFFKDVFVGFLNLQLMIFG
jgi:hypothetical protein